MKMVSARSKMLTLKDTFIKRCLHNVKNAYITTRWIITRSKGLSRKGIEKISRYVRAYVHLVLTSQVHPRSSMVGNSAPAVDAQQVFKSTFKAL